MDGGTWTINTRFEHCQQITPKPTKDFYHGCHQHIYVAQTDLMNVDQHASPIMPPPTRRKRSLRSNNNGIDTQIRHYGAAWQDMFGKGHPKQTHKLLPESVLDFPDNTLNATNLNK